MITVVGVDRDWIGVRMMNKSVIVVDTPDNCFKCAFAFIDNTEKNVYCMAPGKTTNVIVTNYTECRHDDCPLRSVPENRRMKFNDVFDDTCAMGYNQCIDEILAYTE